MTVFPTFQCVRRTAPFPILLALLLAGLLPFQHLSAQTSDSLTVLQWTREGDSLLAEKKYEPATHRYEQAAGLSGRKDALANAHISIGRIQRAAGDNSSALLHYQQARALMADAQGRADLLLFGLATVGEATARLGLSQRAEAFRLYEEARVLAEAEDFKEMLVSIWYHSALILYAQSDIDGALDRFRKSAALMLEVLGPDHSRLSLAYSQIGSIYSTIGEYGEARAYHQKSLTNARQNAATMPENVAIAQTALGQLNVLEGHYAQAFPPLWEAMAILDKTYPEPHPLKGQTLGVLADLHLMHSDQIDSACYFAQRLYDDSQNLYGLRNEATANGLMRLSVCQSRRGDIAQAVATAQRALAAASPHFESHDLGQNPPADDFFAGIYGLDVLGNKSERLLEQWKIDRKPATAQLMFDCLKRGEDVLQLSAVQSFGSPVSDLGAIDTEHYFIKGGLKLMADYHAAAPSPAALAQCHHWMELDKARHLLQATQNTQAQSFAGLPDSLLRRDATLTQNIANFEQNLWAAEEIRDTAAMVQWRDDSLFAAKRHREAFVRRLERDYPAYFELKYKNETVPLEDLQRSLPPKNLFLEISFGLPTDSVLYLLAVGPKNSTLQVQRLAPDMEQKIARLNTLLQSPAVARAPRRAEFVQLSHELYQQFIAPIESQLAGKEHLIVCGEGATQYLPFEVLLQSGADKPVESLDFLIKKMAVSYHYSATLFARESVAVRRPPSNVQHPTSNVQHPPSLLAFAPVFPAATAAAPSDWATRDTALRAVDADGHWSPLPFSEKEAQDITRLFQAKKSGSATTLLREAATEPALLASLAQGHRIVHIASHSFADTRRPKFSGIACFVPDTAAGDGTLYVGEIYNLAAQADLVVLSSCESGLGKLVRSEGLLGLNRAFLYAGVPNVVFSLWKVNDRATADFMVHFYRAVLAGKPYAAALRTAKLNMLSDPATASPNFWSGFLGVCHLR